MTAVSHALIGAAIAAKVSDPATAAGVAFLTHFVCDAIPHWDLGTNWRLRPKVVTGTLAIGETLVALVAGYFLFVRFVASPTVLVLAIVFSLLPDWLEVPYYLTMPHSPKAFYLVYKCQSLLHSKLQAPQGIMTQLIVVTAFLTVGFLL